MLILLAKFTRIWGSHSLPTYIYIYIYQYQIFKSRLSASVALICTLHCFTPEKYTHFLFLWLNRLEAGNKLAHEPLRSRVWWMTSITSRMTSMTMEEFIWVVYATMRSAVTSCHIHIFCTGCIPVFSGLPDSHLTRILQFFQVTSECRRKAQHERVSLHVQWSSQHELSEHPSISLILCTIHSLSSQPQTKLCFSLMQALRSTGRTLDPHQTYSNIAKRAEHAKVLLEGTGHVKRIKDCSFTCLSFTAKHAKRYSLSTLSDIFHYLSPSARHFGAEPRAVSLSFL